MVWCMNITCSPASSNQLTWMAWPADHWPCFDWNRQLQARFPCSFWNCCGVNTYSKPTICEICINLLSSEACSPILYEFVVWSSVFLQSNFDYLIPRCHVVKSDNGCFMFISQQAKFFTVTRPFDTFPLALMGSGEWPICRLLLNSLSEQWASAIFIY